jgi:hypothetical protein
MSNPPFRGFDTTWQAESSTSNANRGRSRQRPTTTGNGTGVGTGVGASILRTHSADARPQYGRGGYVQRDFNQHKETRALVTPFPNYSSRSSPHQLRVAASDVGVSRPTFAYNERQDGRESKSRGRSLSPVNPRHSSVDTRGFFVMPVENHYESKIRLTDSHFGLQQQQQPARRDHDLNHVKDSLIMFGDGCADHSSVFTGMSQQELLQKKRHGQTTERRKEKMFGKKKKKDRIVNLPSNLLSANNRPMPANNREQAVNNRELSSQSPSRKYSLAKRGGALVSDIPAPITSKVAEKGLKETTNSTTRRPTTTSSSSKAGKSPSRIWNIIPSLSMTRSRSRSPSRFRNTRSLSQSYSEEASQNESGTHLDPPSEMQSLDEDDEDGMDNPSIMDIRSADLDPPKSSGLPNNTSPLNDFEMNEWLQLYKVSHGYNDMPQEQQRINNVYDDMPRYSDRGLLPQQELFPILSTSAKEELINASRADSNFSSSKNADNGGDNSGSYGPQRQSGRVWFAEGVKSGSVMMNVKNKSGSFSDAIAPLPAKESPTSVVDVYGNDRRRRDDFAQPRHIEQRHEPVHPQLRPTGKPKSILRNKGRNRVNATLASKRRNRGDVTLTSDRQYHERKPNPPERQSTKAVNFASSSIKEEECVSQSPLDEQEYISQSPLDISFTDQTGAEMSPIRPGSFTSDAHQLNVEPNPDWLSGDGGAAQSISEGYQQEDIENKKVRQDSICSLYCFVNAYLTFFLVICFSSETTTLEIYQRLTSNLSNQWHQ